MTDGRADLSQWREPQALIETALITPPVGLNLFVIQAVGRARIEEVVKGAWPFALMMLSTAVLLWFWQDLALFIPFRL